MQIGGFSSISTPGLTSFNGPKALWSENGFKPESSAEAAKAEQKTFEQKVKVEEVEASEKSARFLDELLQNLRQKMGKQSDEQDEEQSRSTSNEQSTANARRKAQQYAANHQQSAGEVDGSSKVGYQDQVVHTQISSYA